MYEKVKHNIPYLLLLVLLQGISMLYQLLDKKHIVQHHFTVVPKDSSGIGSVFGVTQKNIGVHPEEDFYMKDYVFIGDTAKIKGILHRFEGREEFISTAQLMERDTAINFNEGKPAKNQLVKYYSLQKAISINYSHIPVFNAFINWKGDWNLISQVCKNPLFLFFILFAIFYRMAKRYNLKLTESPKSMVKEISFPVIWIWIPFVFLLLLIFYQEKYYFLQDDNYAQFTPTLIHGLDGWYQNGTFPTYNPLQLGGVPTYEYSTYSFLYPLTHFCYWVAKYLLNDVWQFNNMFAALHFAISYYFTYKLLIFCKASQGISVLGALCFVFCGFNLEASRSWYYVAPTIAFLPMLVFYILKFSTKKFRLKEYLFLILILTIFAYSGNFQFWVYTILFLFLLDLAVQQQKKVKVLLKWGILLSAVVILYAPQLLVTFVSLQSVQRIGGEGQGIWEGIGSVFFPYLYNDALPNGWGSAAYRHLSGHFYYGGFLFLLALLFFTGFWLIRKQNVQKWFAVNPTLRVFIFLALLACLLAIGRPGLLWILQSKLPLLNKFNHPFKFLLFVQFFAIISGVLLVQHFLRFYATPLLKPVFYCCSIGLLLLHIVRTKDAFFVYAIKSNPYPVPAYFHLLDPKMDYRILSLSPSRSADQNFAASLTLNFPTAYRIASSDGYEPFFQNGTDLYAQHRQAGIRYFILGKYAAANSYFTGLQGQLPMFLDYRSFKKIYEDDQVTLLEDDQYEPLVQFFEDSLAVPNLGYRISNGNNGVRIQMNQATKGKQLILNYNFHKNLTVYVNGKKSFFTKDRWNRIVVPLKEAVMEITIQYNPFRYLYGKN